MVSFGVTIYDYGKTRLVCFCNVSLFGHAGESFDKIGRDFLHYKYSMNKSSEMLLLSLLILGENRGRFARR